MGAKRNLPEVVQIEAIPVGEVRSVSILRWRVTPKSANWIKFGSVSGLLVFAGWLLQNFFQLRGIVNLLASRIDLFVLGLVAFLMGVALTIGLRRKRLLRVLIGVSVFAGVVVIDVVSPKSAQLAITAPPNPPVITEVPTVEVRYQSGFLPFFVLPNSTVYLLRLNRKLTDWPDEIRNSNEHSKLEYPQHFKQGSQPSIVYICQITNHSDKDLVDVHISFLISFHQAERSWVRVTKHKGQQSITFPAPGGNKFTWAFQEGKGKRPQSYREGDEIQRQTRMVVLPSIDRHGMGFVYLVNASYYPVRFDLPTHITALVSGSPDAQALKLLRPEVSAFDTSSWSGIPPSEYKWPSTPDDSK